MDADPGHRSALGRWGLVIARHHRLVLAVWLPLLAVAAVMVPTLEDRLATPDYTIRGAESARAQQVIAEQFPDLGDEQAVVVFHSDRLTLRQPGYRRVVTAVLATLRDQSGVVAFDDPLSAAPGLGAPQVSADGLTAVAPIAMRGDATDRARLAEEIQRRVTGAARGSPVQAFFTGSSALNNDTATSQFHDQRVAESLGLPLALVVLVLMFGTVVAAMVPVALALAGVTVCLGVLSMVAGPLGLDQFAAVIATMVGLGVGIDYALFVVSRFREELSTRSPGRRPSRDHVAEALAATMGTAGHTVVSAGLIVAVALGAMAVIDGHVFHEIAFAAALVVACAVTASLTLLPALLTLLGPRLNGAPRPRRHRRAGAAGESAFWGRWAGYVLRHPLWLGLGAFCLLVVAALPVASLRLGLDLGLPALADAPSGRGQQAVAASFGSGAIGPVQIVSCTRENRLDTGDLVALDRFADALRADSRVSVVVSPTDLLEKATGGFTAAHLATASGRPAVARALRNWVDLDDGGTCAMTQVVLRVAVDSTEATDFVWDVRDQVVPAALGDTTLQASVTGLTASYADLAAETTGRLPLVLTLVLGLSFVYLLGVFRSVLLPVKAVLLNLLVTAAALGLTVVVFQFGFGEEPLGFNSVGTLQAYLPVALFTLLFGLSMDYEVFLVRRMQEEWLRTGDNTAAVTTAIARTARQISAAAAIMVIVFGSFLVADSLELQQFGFALAVAVLLDATVVRLVLVPAAMVLASRANWWLPAPLARLLGPPVRRRARHAFPVGRAPARRPVAAAPPGAHRRSEA